MTEVPPARRSLINSRVIPEASCVRICVSFCFYCLVRKYSYLIPHPSVLHISHTNRIVAWSGNRNNGRFVRPSGMQVDIFCLGLAMVMIFLVAREYF